MLCVERCNDSGRYEYSDSKVSWKKATNTITLNAFSLSPFFVTRSVCVVKATVLTYRPFVFGTLRIRIHLCHAFVNKNDVRHLAYKIIVECISSGISPRRVTGGVVYILRMLLSHSNTG